MNLAVFLLLLFFHSWGAKCQNLQPGSGFFTYSKYRPLQEKPIRVFYYIPSGIMDSMPILLVFHGDDRDAQAALNSWTQAADQHRFMVFAPEFSSSYFPGGDGYNLANMFVDGDNPTPQTQNPDSIWTFSLIEPLFDEIKTRTNNQSNDYVAFGHSAGSQFLSRFLLFKPESRMKLAICANAGWYTVPDFQVKFPYGLQQSPMSETKLKSAFAKNMLVLLGKMDTNPNSPGLRHNPQADAQGLNRLARGRYFFSESQKIAESMFTTFNWRQSEVAGVGHDQALMAKNALPFALEAWAVPDANGKKQALEFTYSTEGLRISGLEENEKYEIQAFNLSGQPIWQTSGRYQHTQTIYWKPAVKGIYILNLKPQKSPSQTLKILINK